jgi:hypothetical protein
MSQRKLKHEMERGIPDESGRIWKKKKRENSEEVDISCYIIKMDCIDSTVVGW